MDEPRDVLSASDALVWKIEADPVLRSPIVVVGALDREPSWPQVLAALERAAVAIPRFRRRVIGGGPLARPVWEDDPRFDVRHHARRVRLAEPGGIRSVLDLAEPDAAAAFDPARPPWTFVLVDGLDDGRSAFVLRFHHAISDGVGAIGLAEHVFDRSRHPRRRAPALQVAPTAPASPRPSRSAPALAGQALRLAVDPLGAARRGVRFARSASRLLAAAPEPLSTLLRGRSVDRSLHVLDLPLAGLRAAAGACGGTVNDVWLAAVGGAVRRYHDALGTPLDAVRLTVPISLREAGDAPGGNRFSPARFVLPVGDPDPAVRARVAGELVRRWRGEPALRASAVLAEVLDRLPTAVVTQVFGGMLRGVDVDAVDVPGLARTVYLAGAEVEQLWAFAPPTGAALSATLVSHGERACVGLGFDRAAVADPDLLARCFADALDEVLALAVEVVTR